LKKDNRIHYLVNGFGANDPDSTKIVISKIREILPEESGNLIGLLTLRSDRGDRTLQWIETLKNGHKELFTKIFVTGGHAGIVRRKCRHIEVLREKRPERITEALTRGLKKPCVVLGFGNMRGTGSLLRDHWNRTCEDAGI
jgi:hypothetical protein